MFAEEMAGVPRRVLAARYGIHPGTINRQASLRGLLKRQTGAPDQRCKPESGWPDDRVFPKSPVGMTAGRWREAKRRYLAGEPAAEVAAAFGVTEGAITSRCHADGCQKKDTPGAVYRSTGRRRAGEGVLPVDIDPLAANAPRPPHVLRPAQTPPAGDWRTWLFLGGRGAGKTLAGAEWLADQAERLGKGGRVALIGPTLHDVREVMIEGVSGLRSLPRWIRRDRPVYQPSRRRLHFANGCVAYAFSAEDPDSLRGPQFSAAWADEFCAWPARGPRGAAETLAMLRLGLRLPLGDGAPRLVVTTTPKPTRALIRLRDEASCVLTHAGTLENAAHLSPGFVDDLRALYGGTRREAQELEGRIVDLDGALFTAEMMARARRVEGRGARGEAGGEPRPRDGSAADLPSTLAPRPSPLRYERIVVAIDPPATAGGDACGIVAAASRRRPDGVREAVVLADRSIAGLGPDAWARRALDLARELNAHAIVAEVNQGGDMVGHTLRTAGIDIPYRPVHATRGKRIRAEPVAALYEQGRVRHAAAFDLLEEQLMALGGEMEDASSLDRADALVWAITDLLIDRPDRRGPSVRAL